MHCLTWRTKDSVSEHSILNVFCPYTFDRLLGRVHKQCLRRVLRLDQSAAFIICCRGTSCKRAQLVTAALIEPAVPTKPALRRTAVIHHRKVASLTGRCGEECEMNSWVAPSEVTQYGECILSHLTQDTTARLHTTEA